MRLKHSFSSFLYQSIHRVLDFPCKSAISLGKFLNTFLCVPRYVNKSPAPFIKRSLRLRHRTFHSTSFSFPFSFARQNERSSTFCVKMAEAKLSSEAESSEMTHSVLKQESIVDGKATEGGSCGEHYEQGVISKDEAVVSPTTAPEPLSKRAIKKNLRRERLKEQRKAKRAPNFTKNSSPGFDSDLFGETDYYFENGLRKVYPYPFTFSTYAKERWYGRTIQDIFEKEFRVDSPDNFRKSVATGNMRVNANIVGLDYVLKNGDLIEHCIHRHENPISGQPIEIIEDTSELVVINKPSSIPCHPCGRFRFNSVVFIMGKEFGYSNLRNIYRLDRLTSGVLIMGKTAKKTKELENQVLHRKVHKEYIARVVGEFPEGVVEVKQPLSCLSHKLTLWQVDAKGKPSHTSFRRMSYNGKTSLVKCIPHTGRTHQIRVHLQYLGHPIVNDAFYNSPAWGPLRGKGGHSDVPLEEVCSKIMQEHNVGMWCDGENPLYKEKISAANSASPDSAEASTTSTFEPTAGSEQSQDMHSLLSSPLPKRAKLVPGVTVSTGKEMCTVSDSDAQLSSVILNPASSGKLDGESCHAVSSESLLNIDTKESKMVELGKHSLCSEGGNEKDVRELNTEKVEQKGFDPNRWIPDPVCESCRLKYIDPKPTDLLLYLHACRYKGPTWDYSAKLPDWAQDDWEEPPEYQKYLT